MNEIVLHPGPFDEGFVQPEPRPRSRPATDEDRAALRAEPHVHESGFNAEDAFTVAEEFSWDKVVVDCPRCGKSTAPFRRRDLPAYTGSGWEWVGLDYQQPYADYICVCSSCRKPFTLHTFTPQ